MLPPATILPPPKLSVPPPSPPCDPYSSWGAWKMVRCRLGGNVSRSTRCLAATKGRWGGGLGAAGHASMRGLLTSADSPLRFLSAWVTRSVGDPPSPPGDAAPPRERTVAAGLGCGRGWRARRAPAEKEWNAIRGGESSPRHEFGRRARDTITRRIREAGAH